MNAFTKRPARVARMLGLLALVALPVRTVAGVELSVSYGEPAYTVAAMCDRSQPLAFVRLAVANRGDAASAAGAVTAYDASGVLAGDPTALPPIAAGKSATLTVPLRIVPGSTAPIGGDHLLTIVTGLSVSVRSPSRSPRASVPRRRAR